ncbi:MULTISPECIES: hypothetical protein [unclassified Duganella]|uniref:hypothetical protein n=1 Tax=unclassified Duganella TaxID=2636909 RepID=UPI0008824288|nr:MULTISPECIES: hypothetical protein [unclassified Duganella]SDH31576.1 hypothetical protein SAMN05216320_11219 [Duganella sp. OV458]SDK48388.1 hypothetical protein SAMN05428973_11219 [Duganella sp. OV510]
MNKLCSAWLITGCLGADAAASDPLAPPVPLFAATDRQAALAEALRADATPRLRLAVQPAPLFEARGQRYLSSAEFEQKMGRGIVTVGLLRESGGAPGMQSMSMLLSTRPATRFTSLSLGYALAPHSALVAMVSYGKTAGIGSPDSLLAQMSAVRTLAYSAGLVQRQLFSGNDRLALTWSMPARVRSGSLEYNDRAPLAAAVAGLNLRPTATEHDLEFSYTRAYGRDGSHGRLTGALMWRMNPGHDANARPDLLMGVRYSYGF